MERNAVYGVGSIILAQQLAGLDPAQIDQSHLALMADLSVRAATELDAAIERAEKAEAEARVAEQERPATESQKPPAVPPVKTGATDTKAGNAAS